MVGGWTLQIVLLGCVGFKVINLSPSCITTYSLSVVKLGSKASREQSGNTFIAERLSPNSWDGTDFMAFWIFQEARRILFNLHFVQIFCLIQTLPSLLTYTDQLLLYFSVLWKHTEGSTGGECHHCVLDWCHWLQLKNPTISALRAGFRYNDIRKHLCPLVSLCK